MTRIVTRFAPSPTGFMHVGNLRTGLFAWLVARHAQGQFIVRIEDTDKNREVEGSIEHILECLTMLGIEYDEGPGSEGSHAPYLQSERLEIYHRWALKLVEQGRAYADPYMSEELNHFREESKATKKPFLYRNHRPETLPTWDGKQPLRFKADPKDYAWHDEVMGDLHTGPEVIDDFILIKSDGYPTYNFAHIVDDAEMGVTHVIRGQEFLSSMPNYLNLYEALGIREAPAGSADTSGSKGSAFPAGARQDNRSVSAERSFEADGVSDSGQYYRPLFATMPHIMNEQGNKKLGKRDGAKDVLDYVREGYLPETLLSFIATLGWNDGTEQEVFSRDELIEKFTLDRVQRSGARFDEKRLLWMNGQFIRNLSPEDLYERVKDFWPESAKNADEAYRRDVLSLAQDRLKTLADLPQLTDYFFAEPKENRSLISENKQLKKLAPEEITSLLTQTHAKLSESDWNAQAIQAALNELLEQTGQKPGILFSLIRIATTWAPFSPQLDETLALLGKERTLARLTAALAH